MKKILLAALMAVSCFNLSAQVKNDSIVRDADGRYPVYCTLEIYENFLASKVKTYIDFGIYNNQCNNPLKLKNSDGTVKKFYSNMHALDYLAKRGWILDHTVFLSEGKSNVLHYILKKMVKTDKEILDGIIVDLNQKFMKDLPKTGDDLYDFRKGE